MLGTKKCLITQFAKNSCHNSILVFQISSVSSNGILESLSEEEDPTGVLDDTVAAGGIGASVASSTGATGGSGPTSSLLQSHKESAQAAMAAAMASAMAMMTPTSPRSVTTASMSASGRTILPYYSLVHAPVPVIIFFLMVITLLE